MHPPHVSHAALTTMRGGAAHVANFSDDFAVTARGFSAATAVQSSLTVKPSRAAMSSNARRVGSSSRMLVRCLPMWIMRCLCASSPLVFSNRCQSTMQSHDNRCAAGRALSKVG